MDDELDGIFPRDPVVLQSTLIGEEEQISGNKRKRWDTIGLFYVFILCFYQCRRNLIILIDRVLNRSDFSTILYCEPGSTAGYIKIKNLQGVKSPANVKGVRDIR